MSLTLVNDLLDSQATTPHDLLGHMLILSLRDRVAVPHDELVRAWEHFQLPKVPLPRQRGPVDAFRKATPKQAKGKFSFMPYKGVAKTRDEMLAAVVLVESDDEIGRVDKRHRNLGILALHDDGSSGGYLSYSSDYLQTPEVETFVAQIQDEYERFLTKIDGPQVRHLLSRTLTDISSLTYHNGVYLIPSTQGDTPHRLAEFIRWLSAYAPAPNDVYLIPYLDTPETRQDIRQTLKSHIGDEATRILQAAHDFVRKGGDPSKQYGGRSTPQTLLQDLAGLDAMLRDYEATLNEVQTDLIVFLGAKKQLVRQLLAV